MSKNIQVILLEDIAGVGHTGDIVSVSEGYARNNLFSNGKAALATDSAKQEQDQRVSQASRAKSDELTALQDQAEALDGTELTLTARLKEGDEIFGSITAAQITKELNQQAKLDLKAKDINLAKPITTTGSHSVVVRLSADVEATIQVTVVPESGSEPATTEKE